MIAAVVLFLQADDQTIHFDRERLYSVQLPNRDWSFRADRRLEGALVSLRRGETAVEVFVEIPKKEEKRSLDPVEWADREIRALSAKHKKVETKERNDKTLFPGDGNPKCVQLRLLVDERFEWHEWVFISEDNGHQYRIVVLCPPAGFDARKDELQSILYGFRTYKPR